MRILTKYLLREYLKPFILVVLSFMVIIVISEFFDRIDTLIKFKPGVILTLKYFFWRSPEWLVYIMPLSLLLATLFSLGNLSRNNEISAMNAAGVSMLQITLPILIFALATVALLIVFNDFVVPEANRKSTHIYNVRIRGQKSHPRHTQWNIVVTGLDQRKYTIHFLDLKKKLMKEVTIDELNPGLVLLKQIYAREVRWNDTIQPENKDSSGKKHSWIFLNGVIREFDSNGKNIISETEFSKREFLLPETIDDFYNRPERLKHMSYRKLRKHIEKLTRNGIPSNRERVALHSKIAYPFSCFIVVLLGIPFALRTPKNPRMISFALAIFIIFFFWGIISVGQALGENKVLPPIIAAWFANIIFGSFAIVMIRKTRI